MIRTAVLLGFLIAAPSAASAGEPAPVQVASQRPFLGGWLRETRVVYPLRVGDWEAMGEHRYERAESGASVRYQHRAHKDRWMDLYFYPSGVLPDAAFAQVVARGAADIATARRKAGHRVDEVTPARTFAAPGPHDRLLGALAVKPRSVGFVLEQDRARYHSVLAMTLREMHFVKVRFSAEASALALENLRGEGESFLAGFAGAVRILNTGDCWKVLDIATLPADRRKPDDLLASANEGTDAEVWVREDRLYVVSPEAKGDAAREAAVGLGQSLHDAVRGRCVAPESMNPVVPEDMREMRFEYGTPDGSNPLPASRSAPTRT